MSCVAELLARERSNLRLPAEWGSNVACADPVAPILEAPNQLPAGEKRVARAQRNGAQGRLSMIWSGDGRNPNAALTVFRHFDSATVVKGLVGDQPKTAWVIGYPLFERIYYLLVAGYDVYRQHRAPVEQPPLHGLPAHGRRVQLPRASAGESSTLDGRITGIEARRRR